MSGADERDLVVDLPTSVSCSFLRDWVSTEDLVRLDSSYCCHEKRRVVLDMFRSKEFLCTDDMPSYKIHRVSTQFWDWILQRDIKLFHITVRAGVDEPKLESYAKRHERYIGNLDLVVVKSNGFALHCKHLVQLTCDLKANSAFETVLQNNPNLQLLDLRGLKEKHIESFKTISLPHLTQVRLNVGVCSAERVAAVLAMPARLLKLDLWNINTHLTGVAKLCPHLRSLSLDMYNYESEVDADFDLIEFISHLPHLVNLQLVDITDLDDAMVLAVMKNVKQLRFLNLLFNKCDCDLSDAGIGYIAEHCAATLEVFGLETSDSGTAITNDSLDLLRARCTNLRKFRVEAIFEYSDNPLDCVTTLVVEDTCSNGTLVEISNECPQLEVLHLKAGVVDCTLPTLRALCRKCPKLHCIVVHWNCLAFACMQSLTATLPQIRVTDSFDDDCLDVMKMPI